MTAHITHTHTHTHSPFNKHNLQHIMIISKRTTSSFYFLFIKKSAIYIKCGGTQPFFNSTLKIKKLTPHFLHQRDCDPEGKPFLTRFFSNHSHSFNLVIMG